MTTHIDMSFLSKPHCPYPRLLLLFSIAVRTRLGWSKGLDGKFNKIRRIMMGLMNEPDAETNQFAKCIHYEPTLTRIYYSGTDEY